MKLAMFTDKESFIESCLNFIKAYERELETQKAILEDEQKGIGKEEFFEMNKVGLGGGSGYNKEVEWIRHIEWRRGNVKYLKRKIREFYKKIEEAERR